MRDVLDRPFIPPAVRGPRDREDGVRAVSRATRVIAVLAAIATVLFAALAASSGGV